jgi:membrane-associated PAP2 superfamily phosphatase
MMPPPPRFLLTHAVLPLVVFMLLAIMLEMSSIDLWLADHLFAWEGGSWSLRDSWITRDLIHEDGRRFITVLAVALLLFLFDSHFHPRLKPFRPGLWYLLASTIVAALAINVLKGLTHVDCPWDLTRYGGEFPYIKKFLPHTSTHGACFPAGHASAGYAWFGLYYFALMYAPRWRWLLLAGVMAVGLLFGIGQQLRGAHFLSHDLWTLGLCWLSATAVYWVFAKYASTTTTPGTGNPQLT